MKRNVAQAVQNPRIFLARDINREVERAGGVPCDVRRLVAALESDNTSFMSTSEIRELVNRVKKERGPIPGAMGCTSLIMLLDSLF